MKWTSSVLAVLGCLAAATPLIPEASTPADAAYVTRGVHHYHNRFGRRCVAVRTVIHRRFGPNTFRVHWRCRR